MSSNTLIRALRASAFSRPGPALAAITALAALASACGRSASSGAGSTVRGVIDEDSFPTDTIVCAPGEGSLVAYSFNPTALAPEREEIGLKGTFAMRPPQKTRIDLCLNEDTLEVFPKRVVTWSNEGGAGAWSARARILTRDGEPADATFAEAIMENDFSRLETRFVAADANETSWLLKGWKTVKGETFVTLSPYVAKSGKHLDVAMGASLAKDGWKPYIQVGMVEEGDPFAPKKECERRTIEAVGLTLSYGFCKWGSHATRITYAFDKVDVKDATDASVAPRIFSAAGAEAERAAQMSNTHHSLSDALSVTVGDRVYHVNPRTDLAPGSRESERFELRVEKDGRSERLGLLACDYVYQCGTNIAK